MFNASARLSVAKPLATPSALAYVPIAENRHVTALGLWPRSRLQPWSRCTQQCADCEDAGVLSQALPCLPLSRAGTQMLQRGRRGGRTPDGPDWRSNAEMVRAPALCGNTFAADGGFRFVT
jgi:hypothetical protein